MKKKVIFLPSDWVIKLFLQAAIEKRFTFEKCFLYLIKFVLIKHKYDRHWG